jgi:integrase
LNLQLCRSARNIISPEQAFRIMMELGESYRTLVFLVAVTGLRISEALGLKWSDLDYERRMIPLERVWVGNELVARLKTEGSEAPVPLGELLADALQSWHRNTLYAKPDDWVFPSTKMKGKTPLSASIMAKDKIRPADIKAGVRLEPGQRFGFHNFRHSLATFLISKGKNFSHQQRQRCKDDSRIAAPCEGKHNPGPVFAGDG